MKLRWLNQEPLGTATAQEVREYRDALCCSMDEAKRALHVASSRTLQYHDGEKWVDVPEEYEFV